MKKAIVWLLAACVAVCIPLSGLAEITLESFEKDFSAEWTGSVPFSFEKPADDDDGDMLPIVDAWMGLSINISVDWDNDDSGYALFGMLFLEEADGLDSEALGNLFGEALDISLRILAPSESEAWITEVEETITKLLGQSVDPDQPNDPAELIDDLYVGVSYDENGEYFTVYVAPISPGDTPQTKAPVAEPEPTDPPATKAPSRMTGPGAPRSTQPPRK